MVLAHPVMRLLVRFLVILLGALLVLALGHVILETLYERYWNGVLASGGGGDDDQNHLSMFVVFVEVPVLLILGASAANRLYRKCLSRFSGSALVTSW